MIEKYFTNILEADLAGNYVFQKNYLGSMCRVKNKTLLQLSDHLDSKGIKGGRTMVNKINKGILPKKYKVRVLISDFLDMDQKDIFINIEKLRESKTEYLGKNKRNITT